MRTHKRAHSQSHKRAAKITEKRPPDADDKHQQKEHNYTVIHIHKSAAEIIEIAVPR